MLKIRCVVLARKLFEQEDDGAVVFAGGKVHADLAGAIAADLAVVVRVRELGDFFCCGAVVEFGVQ